jgi:hypothetical protein
MAPSCPRHPIHTLPYSLSGATWDTSRVSAPPRAAAGATNRATTTIQHLLPPPPARMPLSTSTPTRVGRSSPPAPRCICELGMTSKMEKEATPSRRGRLHRALPRPTV